jgi:uracil-DNA glycosylase family 4
MEGRRRVLSTANGPCPAGIMLIGEAPGRLGAQRSGVPFEGDVAGQRLSRLLAAAGWSREELFITNAVLCNPLDDQGHNRPPSRDELDCCLHWLEAQVEVVNPTLVIAMGRVALEATQRITAHELSLAAAGDAPIAWHGRRLAAVYHPGARAAVHRAFDLQEADFAALGRWYRALTTKVITTG